MLDAILCAMYIEPMNIFYQILWTIAGFFFLALFPIAVCVGVYLGICWIKERK